MDSLTTPPDPTNEPALDYRPGSPERAALRTALSQQLAAVPDIRPTIDGRCAGGRAGAVPIVRPDRHGHQLATMFASDDAEAYRAVEAALRAGPAWRDLSYDDRAAIFLKAADLLAGPWRQVMNAATMLGQSKTVVQAEIDSACELIDFWRFNVQFGHEIYQEQPARNAPGVWNRLDHRPLEGFVYAVTPFNFTAIAGNLPTAPALMGNTVVWKPATTQAVAANLTLRLLEQAGLPPGVINLVTGNAVSVTEVVLASPDLAGIHFTGSTTVFQGLWQTVARRLPTYRSYPRLVGETGGKDFVLVHPSADDSIVRTALVRGAFEYQGQKCSAASRAYLPRSVWRRVRDELVADIDALAMGDVTDFSNFMGAVIDARAFARVRAAVDRAANLASATVLAGGTYDDSVGYFVRPTLVECENPTDDLFTTEYFGPLLAVHVYEDSDFETVAKQLDAVSHYALTGSILAQDRAAIAWVSDRLRFAAGNFYINDKPTGAVVGQQPFGGGRASGTNDKAGAASNLRRWVSTRAIKESFVPATRHDYPHMAAEGLGL